MSRVGKINRSGAYDSSQMLTSPHQAV